MRIQEFRSFYEDWHKLRAKKRFALGFPNDFDLITINHQGIVNCKSSLSVAKA